MTRQTVKFLVFGASLRANSLNDRLATLAATIVQQQGGAVDRARMGDFDCPPFDGDVERDAGIPDPARALCRRITDTDAFIIASPEYNASMPGHLKNAIDWASRFRPQPFNGKQALLLSASPSMIGGNRGLWALRIPLEHLGARIYPDMFSLAQAHEAFGDNHRLKNDVLQQRLETTISCFMDLVEAAKHYPALKKEWVEFLGERPDATIDRVETNSTQAA
ncbi:MAG TPA: NAD(P)H-dependent oxidoreductase [Gemmatimonadaceae bacterium]|nr:NAD(P)H-dependent oxidoreductase [Gemmatimonadaceae bacterium]